MPKKILVVGPSWIGDMVMAQSLFKLLKQQEPDCEIDVLATPWTFALLHRMPEVKQAISFPLRHGELGILQRYRIGRSLQERHYDQAIVIPNSWKSALVPFFANIPVRTGWRGELRYGLLNDIRLLDEQRYPLMVERMLALALPPEAKLSFPYPYPELIAQAPINRSLDQTPILALCPGAQYGEAKRWPVKHFAAVANEKLSAGWQVWLFGSQDDLPAAKAIQTLTADRCTNWIGQSSLAESIDLLAQATVVVTNDSGLMHVAAALRLPLVALYGSSSPTFTPPLSDQAKLLSLHLSCSPCFRRTCPLGHLNCLEQLSPALVLQAIEELMHQ